MERPVVACVIVGAGSRHPADGGKPATAAIKEHQRLFILSIAGQLLSLCLFISLSLCLSTISGLSTPSPFLCHRLFFFFFVLSFF